MQRRLPLALNVKVVLAAIVLQAIAGLVLGLPGHLSSDSIVQLYEARTLEFISFQPPLMSLLLRAMDASVPGTALFVVLDQLLLTTSFVLLLGERGPALRRPAAVAAAIVVLNPLLLAYTGIVWKDVLMSHLAAFGYVCLYLASRRTPGHKRIAWALAAVFALSLAAALRQHALLLAIPGATFAAYLLARRRVAQTSLTIVFSAVIVGLNVGIIAYADEVAVGEKIPRMGAGLRSLTIFDLAGIAANGGAIPDAAVATQVDTALVPFYTPLRNDPLPPPVKGSALWNSETRDLLSLWGRSILNSPRAYLSHRSAHFWALLWKSGSESLCTPVFAGVQASVYVPSLHRDIVPELRLQGRSDLRDRRLAARQLQMMGTPVFNHVFWALVLFASAIVHVRRGGAGALVVFAASAIAFALAFSVIGISCEFRYIYVLPVAATLLLFVLATAPRPGGNPAHE